MKTKDLTSSAVSITGTLLGAMASRVIAENVPVKNSKVRSGVLAGVGLIGASFLDRREPTNAFVQDVAIGVTATQLGSLIKELVGETKGTIKTALGNPFSGDIDFLASYQDDDYDFIPTLYPEDIDVDYDEVPVNTEIVFRK